jgi:hypothetical protein
MLLWPAGLLAVLSVPVVTSVPAPWPIISIHHQAGLDCNQYYHLLWLPDCSGRKTEQCAERRGESSRGGSIGEASDCKRLPRAQFLFESIMGLSPNGIDIYYINESEHYPLSVTRRAQSQNISV